MYTDSKVFIGNKLVNVQTGDATAVRRKFNIIRPISYLSWAIRIFTGFRYNHTELLMVKDGIVYTVGAHSNGVIKQLFGTYAMDPDLEIEYLKKPEDVIVTNDEVESLIGLPYDYWTLIFFQVIYRLTGLWLGKVGEKSEGKVVCSELVAIAWGIPKSHLASTKEVYEFWLSKTTRND